jgi:hypothetical protein
MTLPSPEFPWVEADAMYLLLVRRAADLRGLSPPGSSEEVELDRVATLTKPSDGRAKEKTASVGGLVHGSIAMGIFDWLLGHGDEEEGWSGGWTAQPPPIPSKPGAGPDLDKARYKTQTEKDLGVQGQHDPERHQFDLETERPAKYD